MVTMNVKYKCGTICTSWFLGATGPDASKWSARLRLVGIEFTSHPTSLHIHVNIKFGIFLYENVK